MKKLVAIFFVVCLFSVANALNIAWGQEKNLGVNEEATAKIRAYDREFFKGFDVYSVWVKDAPMALLFDSRDDDYYIASRFWGEPLKEAEIAYILHNLNGQYYNTFFWDVPYPPRALNIVNLKGQVVGYVYTGFDAVLMMDRKKDGSVTVYPPDQQSGGGGGGAGGGAGAGGGH